MRVIYFDCSMGAAGDMLTAALLELHSSPENFLERVNALGIPGIKVSARKDKKCGITGTNVTVSYFGRTETDEYHHESHGHHHMSAADISEVIDKLPLSEKIKSDSKNVFSIIANAESYIHGENIENIHFHELGTMDAVADVVCVSMLINELAPDLLIASPINTGCGTVKCAHGIMPVPAPATSRILMGIPMYAGNIKSELCTPTGAALLKYFVSSFSEMPVMVADAIGYGMGDKDFERPNCVRAFIGRKESEQDEVVVLSCNLDDMTGESIGFACERLLAVGVLDVYTIPVNMKKSRPGIILQCICKNSDREDIAKQIFKYTTTLGVRAEKCSRYVLNRTITEKDTPYGTIRVKSSSGWGVEHFKPEYDDISKAAVKNNISLDDIKRYI